MTLACVLPLAACLQTVRVSDCDGVAKLTPSSETRRTILSNDRPFARAGGEPQSILGRSRCWK
ncbi:hypothetical protein CYK37_20680 [Mesorhizobium loti]|nr:hypothetical protein CYK37_20680 [Mesorhizobium loti]